MTLPELETGQHHFEIVNGQIEVAPYLLPPVPFRYPNLFAEIAELNEEAIDDPLYDRIIKLWFNSKLAPPPEYFKLIYQEFLRPAEPLKDAVDTEEKIVRQVMETARVDSYKAIGLIQDMLLYDIYDLVNDLRNWYDDPAEYDEPVEEVDEFEREHPILLYDRNKPDRFVKQFALAGIFTLTQIKLLHLDLEQMKKIKKIRVPKKFTRSYSLDEFVGQVEEIQTELIDKDSASPRRKKHNQ